MINGFIGVVIINFLTVQRNRTCDFFTDTKQGFHDIGTFCTDQARDAQNFAFVQIERHITNRRLAQGCEVTHFKNHFTRLVLFIREALVQGTAHHHRDDLVHIQPFKGLSGDPLTVTQNGDFIA
ncbi:hypothetical protein D3C80_298270 [compost metagenome]